MDLLAWGEFHTLGFAPNSQSDSLLVVDGPRAQSTWHMYMIMIVIMNNDNACVFPIQEKGQQNLLLLSIVQTIK
jgi:hypothetical protein